MVTPSSIHAEVPEARLLKHAVVWQAALSMQAELSKDDEAMLPLLCYDDEAASGDDEAALRDNDEAIGVSGC